MSQDQTLSIIQNKIEEVQKRLYGAWELWENDICRITIDISFLKDTQNKTEFVYSYLGTKVIAYYSLIRSSFELLQDLISIVFSLELEGTNGKTIPEDDKFIKFMKALGRSTNPSVQLCLKTIHSKMRFISPIIQIRNELIHNSLGSYSIWINESSEKCIAFKITKKIIRELPEIKVDGEQSRDICIELLQIIIKELGLHIELITLKEKIIFSDTIYKRRQVSR